MARRLLHHELEMEGMQKGGMPSELRQAIQG